MAVLVYAHMCQMLQLLVNVHVVMRLLLSYSQHGPIGLCLDS